MRKYLLFAVLSVYCTLCLQAQPYYFNPDVQTIAANYGCNGCHGGTSGFFITSYTGILAGGNDCGETVIPFNADASPLVWQIDPAAANCPGKPDMPLGGPTVAPADIALIREWINSGALESAASACADLVISAYVEGASFNKCVEIYNGTGTDVDLSGYTLDIYNNGNTSANENIPLSGILANGEYYLICHDDFALPGLTPNQTSTQLLYNGNDAIAINNGSANVDVLGQIGIDPGTSWLNGDCSTENATLVKINNGTGCIYGVFSGTTDFTPVLGSFYACFAADDVSALNTYVPGCPTIDAPLVADVFYCQDTPIPTLTAQVASPDLNVTWFDALGNIIATGLEFTPEEAAEYSAQAFDANGCTSEKVPVIVTQLALPFVESIDYTCSPDGLSYEGLMVCSGIAPFTVSSVNNVTPVDEVTFLISGMASGEAFSVSITDDNGCTNSFSDAFTCIVLPDCPELTAIGNTELLFCPGSSTEGATLKVNVANANETDIQWSTGETGVLITLPNLTTDSCDGSVFTYTAFIPAGIDCPEVSVTYTITVLPDPSLNVQLVYDEANCVVSVEGVCPQFMTETSINGEPNLPGVAVNLAPGETAEVLFTIYDPTDLCPTLPYLIGGIFTCVEDFAFSGGAIWFDDNTDGFFDETTETGAEGVAAYLIDAATNDTIAADVSNVFGYFYFEFIPTGTYYIQIDPATLPPNAIISGGINETGQSVLFTLGSGESFSLAVPLLHEIIDPCLLQPIVINTQEINSCSDGTYMVRLLVTGGYNASDYTVLVNDAETISLAANVVAELGPFTLGTGYTISVTDAVGCTALVNGFAICTVPVSLLSFTGTAAPTGNLLRWVTATQTNNHYFTLHRSINGIDFTPIAQLNGAGNSSTSNTYTFTDTNAPDGISYYQLLQTDYNGNTTQAGSLSLFRGNTASFGAIMVSPVPVQHTATVWFSASGNMQLRALLYDVSGKLVLSEQVQTQPGQNSMSLNMSHLADGIYFLNLQTPLGFETVKVVKQ